MALFGPATPGVIVAGLAAVSAVFVGVTLWANARTAVPDPRIVAAADPSPVPVPQYEVFIEPAVGSFAVGYRRAAAPLAESSPADLQRVAQPALEHQLVVVGRNARATFDDETEAGYRRARTDVRCETFDCTDREVVELLMLGRADFGLIGGSLSEREVRAGLRQTRIGVELFALSVPQSSSVRSLTRTQVRQIFTGQVTDWQQLGFDGGEIVAVVPADHPTAERAARALMPGDGFVSTCIKVRDEAAAATVLQEHPGAIAIIRNSAREREPGQKLLQIDWTPPTPEAFGYGTYPFGVPLQLVTSGRPDAQAQGMLDFAASEAGQQLLSRTLTFVK